MPKRLSKTLDTGTNLRKLQFIGDLMLDKRKCDQIRSWKLRTSSHLLKQSLIKSFSFCAVKTCSTGT